MLLDRLRISSKLVLLAAIPLLGLGVLVVPVVSDRVTAARVAGDTSTSVRAASDVAALIRELQRERLLSVGYLAGQSTESNVLLEQADVADRNEAVHRALGSDLTPALTEALTQERNLEPLRAKVLTRTASMQQIAVAFDAVIGSLIDSLDLSAHADATTSAGRQVLGLDAVVRADENKAEATTTVIQIFVKYSPSLVSQLTRENAFAIEYGRRFTQLATLAQADIFSLIQDALNARSTVRLSDGTDGSPPGSVLPGETLTGVFPIALSFVGQSRFVEAKVVADILAATAEQRRVALIYTWAISAAAVLVLIVGMFFTVVLARNVARPLIRLTASAERVAAAAEAELTRVTDDEADAFEQVRLDAVDMTGRDEIGDLARAFDRVQGTAARLVERHAASRRNVATMFGHIGRRTQNLVGRQLAMIDRLEQQETNSERLRHLYQLDHLSSRLSRNAGSLVVLSGSTANDEHAEPLPVADVVRLALGEIEDYTRVEVDIPEHLIVRPAVVGDLTLVFAELMENATAYSPPHTNVRVTAEATRAGAQILIIDHGIGMAPERLAEENARLTRRERLDLVPTEVLGLFVTGRLGRRHGFSVTLVPTPGGGITAVIALTDLQLLGPAPARPSSRSPGTSPETASADVGTELAVPDGQDFAPVTFSSSAFDQAALERATSAIAGGMSWDAFAVTAGPVTAGRAPGGPAAIAPQPAARAELTRAPSQDLRPAPKELPPPERWAAAESGPVADRATVWAEEVESQSWWERSIEPPPAEAPPAAPPRLEPPRREPPRTEAPRTAALQRRIPGAQLPVGVSARRIEPPAAVADPAAARALVEEFEAGVRSAERQRDTDSVPRIPAPRRPGATPVEPLPAAPAAPLPVRPAPSPVRAGPSLVPPAVAPTPSAGGPAGGPAPASRHGLARRVPGATLGLLQKPARAAPAAPVPVRGDADAARALIEQIESGVSRALTDVVVDDHRHEGLPR